MEVGWKNNIILSSHLTYYFRTCVSTLTYFTYHDHHIIKRRRQKDKVHKERLYDFTQNKAKKKAPSNPNPHNIYPLKISFLFGMRKLTCTFSCHVFLCTSESQSHFVLLLILSFYITALLHHHYYHILCIF